ncbi:MAG: hypothetical protein II008_20375 [Oscillospiraceae bacterium]|nr:hypothetical protein [Oscillospiraceae bacterium]
MRINDRIPTHITVSGRRYRIDTDFRNVMRMNEIMRQTDLTDEARDWLALRCLMRHPPRRRDRQIEALKALHELLFSSKRGGVDEKKITDIEQDAELIFAAFLQEYGVNLWRDRLSWFEFTALLAGIAEGTRYSDILTIRARPMPKPTKWNGEEREWLAKAKAVHALTITDDEQAEYYDRSVRSIFDGLLSMAGGKHGG